MTLTVNGIDMTPYIAYQGFKWQRNDVDGPDAWRSMDSTMHRERISTKIRLDITCRPLYANEAKIVLTAIMPEYVRVTYYDPQEGQIVTKVMYSNNNPASFCHHYPSGKELWHGITFPLVER